MHDQDSYTRTRSPDVPIGEYQGTHESTGAGSKVKAAAETAKDTATGEAKTVGRTAKEEAGAVVDEAKGQARRLASDVRERAGPRVRDQHGRLVDRLREFSDELAEMAGSGDGPARAVVGDVAARGRRVADYLADRGPEGVLSEVQDFARRRPMAFLAVAATAGFVAGRLGKGIWKAQSEGTSGATAGGARSALDGGRSGSGDVGSTSAGNGGWPTAAAVADITPAALPPESAAPPASTVAPTTAEDVVTPLNPTSGLYASGSAAAADPLYRDDRYDGGEQR